MSETTDAMDATDATIATYEQAAVLYREQTTHRTPGLDAFLDRLAELVLERKPTGGLILEVGSGPGLDADHLENRGVRVLRSDAAAAFVDMLRSSGHDARLIDVRTDDLAGPYDGVLADAVLLHLSQVQFAEVLVRLRRAVTDGGILAFTVKEGDGGAWSDAKLGLPRWFTYWNEAPVREVLARTGWSVLSVDHVAGRSEPWLYVLARAADESIIDERGKHA